MDANEYSLMKKKEQSERIKLSRLREAVKRKSPDKVKELIEKDGLPSGGAVVSTLAYACRYRGLDMVKVLIEGGVGERESDVISIEDDPYDANEQNCYTTLFDDADDEWTECARRMNDDDKPCRPVLPLGERLRILEYVLAQESSRTRIDTDEMLSLAYLRGETKFVLLMKKPGVTFSEAFIDRSVKFPGNYQLELHRWKNSEGYSGERFISVFSDIIREISEIRKAPQRIFMTMTMWHGGKDGLFTVPEVAHFLIHNFILSPYMKVMLLADFVDAEDIQSLETAARAGWLASPERRDIITRYAADKGRAESASWLLEYIARNFDLKAERERAERQRQKLFDAEPYSIAVMRRLWKWEKRPDGSVIITGYLGSEASVKVPERIGKRVVTAIAKFAFRAHKEKELLMLPPELRYEYSPISEIVLPDTLTKIGSCAFFDCDALRKINIPPKITELPDSVFATSGIETIEIGGNVKRIDENAFMLCRELKTVVMREGVEEIVTDAFYGCSGLTEIELPRSLRSIAGNAFFEPSHGQNTAALTAKVHKGSYAEEYCERQMIPFVYFDE